MPKIFSFEDAWYRNVSRNAQGEPQPLDVGYCVFKAQQVRFLTAKERHAANEPFEAALLNGRLLGPFDSEVEAVKGVVRNAHARISDVYTDAGDAAYAQALAEGKSHSEAGELAMKAARTAADKVEAADKAAAEKLEAEKAAAAAAAEAEKAAAEAKAAAEKAEADAAAAEAEKAAEESESLTEEPVKDPEPTTEPVKERTASTDLFDDEEEDTNPGLKASSAPASKPVSKPMSKPGSSSKKGK